MSQTQKTARMWHDRLSLYAKPSLSKSLFQVFNTSILLIANWALMLYSLEYHYTLILIMAIPAAFLLVRLFIVQHDCGHGSYFTSRTANDRLGSIIGVLTLTPYFYWRKMHNLHHKNSGDLDNRAYGEIWLLTVDEYCALSTAGRLWYRLYRHPLILLGIGPLFQFFLKHRFPFGLEREDHRERRSVWWTNLGILILVAVMWLLVGWKALCAIQLPISIFASIIGIWLFYVQHNFRQTYWRRSDQWTFFDAGIKGSSFLDLPRLWRWLTGNIGLHHVHHLKIGIPNYRLMSCVSETPELQKQATRLTFWAGLKCLQYKLWDEQKQELVSFREARMTTNVS